MAVPTVVEVLPWSLIVDCSMAFSAGNIRSATLVII